MKSYFPIILITGLILLSCKPSVKEAVDYNNRMIHKQDSLISCIDSLDQMIIQRDTVNLIKFHKHILETIEKEIDLLNKYKDFNNSNEYKINLSKLFIIYRETVRNEYGKVIAISLLSCPTYEKDTIDKFNNLIKNINKNFSDGLNDFIRFQKEFAGKYNFSLVEEIN